MNTLINVQPTGIVHRADVSIFYYGVKPGFTNQLVGKADFSVVYSPIAGQGWEYVHYQVLEEQNGLVVLERRALNADEIAYHEQLIARQKVDSDNHP